MLGGASRADWGAARVRVAREAKFAPFAALAAEPVAPIRPERLVATLDEVLDAQAILVADPGTPCPYLSAYHRIDRAGRHYWSNRAHGALGYSLAAAIGAAVGRPGTRAVAMMGDGSFGMCCGEFETLVRLGLPVTAIVVSNATYGWIKAGQRSGFEQRYFSVDFGRTDHARVAEAFGVRAWRVTDPLALRDTLAAALESDGPNVVDVHCQPLHEARAPVSEWIA